MRKPEIVLDKYLPGARNEEIKGMAEEELENLRQMDDLYAKESHYRVKNLQDLNTEYAEYSPVYKDNFLFFTSNRDGGKIYRTTGTPYTNIYQVATKGANINIGTLKSLHPVINHVNTNEGSIAIAPDGKSFVFAKGNNGKANGFTEVNIFFTRFRNGSWSEPRPLSINVADAWDSCPAFTPDGTTLYFASNRPEGFGGTDIYMAKINRRGRWVDVRKFGFRDQYFR